MSLRVITTYCPDHDTASTPQEFNIKAAVKQLAANVAHKHWLPSSTTLQRCLERRAWALLLDRDAERHQEVPEVLDRADSNRIAVGKACGELRQQLRPADATKLQQLLEDWQRTHYEPWVPPDPHDLSPTPDPVPLTEQQAILSVLLALRGSCPAPPPRFTALPALGSTAIAEVQQRAEAAVAAAGAPAGRYLGLGFGLSVEADAYAVLEVACGSAVHAAAGAGRGQVGELLQQQQGVSTCGFSSSWIPATVPATELLQHLQLDPALSTSAAALGAQCSDDTRLRDQSCKGLDAAGLPSGNGCQVMSLVTDLAKKMQLSSGPYAGFSSCLGLQTIDPASVAAAGVASKRSSCHSSRQQHAAVAATDHSSDVSRTAVDAEAAVAAAAAVQPMVAPLMMLSCEKPGFGGLQLLGQTPNQSSFLHVLDTLKGFDTCSSKQAVLDSKDSSSKAHLPPWQHENVSPAAQRAAAEEQLVSLSCLALQGVWSAVGQLWEIAQQGGAAGNSSTFNASRWPGLARPAAQQHLLVQILHMAELRLRIQTFLQHFQSNSSSNSSSKPSSHSSTGNGPATATDQAVLHTFLSAVKDVLDMHHAAIQAIQHELQQRKQQQKRRQYQRQQQAAKGATATSAAAAAAPAMTLLLLVVMLRSMLAQLQQLADCCWCNVGDPVDSGCGFGVVGFSSFGSTSTQRLLKALMPYGCAAAAVGGATVNSRPHRTAAAAAGGGGDWVNALSSNSPARHSQSTEAAAAVARAAAAAARAAALPWPTAAAAWVRLWNWDPSRWQVKQGFMQGQALAEYLYAELLHAGPQTAPLPRHLFAAAVQPLIQQIHSWAFQPGGAAAEAAAAAAAITSIAAVGRSSRSRITSQIHSRLGSSNGTAAGYLGQDTITLATAAAAAAGCTMEAAAAGTNTAAEAAAAEILLQAWTAAQDRAPECPRFLAGIQQQVAVAGLQLQLLQLLGGPGQQLAQHIGWLAELELQELREVFAGSSSSNGGSSGGSEDLRSRRSSRHQQDGDMITPPAAAAVQGMGCSNASGLSLLMGSRGAAAAPAAPGQAAEGGSQAGSSAGAAYLPFTLSIGQLKQAAAIISDYEHAREAELSELMGRFTDAKAAAAEAQQAREDARLQDKAVAEEAQQQLRQAAAARRAQRKRQLLLEQKEEMAAAAARRAKSRRDELAFERQLLAQHAAAEHKAALQQVQQELAAAHRVGVQVPAAWQRQQQQQQRVTVSGSASAHKGSLNSGNAQVAAAAPQQQQQEEENALAVEQRGGLNQQQQEAAAAEPHQPEGSAAAIVDARPGSTTLVDDDVPAAQQQRQQQQPAGISHKRATWGPAVFDPTPAAGKTSAAEPLAVVGSAAVAAAAAMPAAGRRSNSAPRILPGMGSVLSPDQRRPRSSDSAVGFGNANGSGSRRSSQTGFQGWGQGLRRKAEGGSLISGVLDHVDGGLDSAAGAAGLHKPVGVTSSNWNSVPGTTDSITSRDRRPSSAAAAAAGGGSSGGARPWQQQGAGCRRSMHSRGSSYSGVSALAADVLVVEDSVPDVASEYQASLAAAAAGGTGTAAAASSSPVISRWQHQQQQLGFIDSRRATAAGTEYNRSVGGYGYSPHPYQQQQQQQEVDQSTDTSHSSAPLVTTLEVLVINPILAQHRLTTLACWQLLLQEQQLLQKLAAMQGLFFQQQGDWVDLFLEGFDNLIAPAATGGEVASGLIGSSSSSSSDGAPVWRAGSAGFAGVVGVGKQGLGLGLSDVAAQLVLESALQQSCLAGDEVTQRLSVQVNPKRSLPGWGTACRSLQSRTTPNNTHSASATDQIVLHYEVPWPVSLLITEQQRQQYAQVFSVLLRLRRLQQQLTKQWAAINSRPGSSSSGKIRSGVRSALISRWGSQAGSRSVSRADTINPHHQQQQQQQSDAQGYSIRADSADAAAADHGLDRLQQLRRWHAMALHCVSSMLATMLSELSGKLWGDFAAAVTAQPVSLPDMIEAHARLLAAAQEVCLLPAFETSSGGASGSSGNGSGHLSRAATPTGESKLRKSIGRLSMSMEFAVSFGSPRIAAAAVVNGTDVANLVYQLSDAAWQLQQQVQQLLMGMPAHAAAARAAPAVSSNRSADSVGLGLDEITLEVPEEGFGSSQAAGGFRDSSTSRVLAGMLVGDEGGSCWQGVKVAGWNLEGLLRTLNKHLANNRAAGVGEALAGLAARLGAMKR